MDKLKLQYRLIIFFVFAVLAFFVLPFFHLHYPSSLSRIAFIVSIILAFWSYGFYQYGLSKRDGKRLTDYGKGSIKKLCQHFNFPSEIQLINFAVDILEKLWHFKIEGYDFLIRKDDELKKIEIEFQPFKDEEENGPDD